MDKSFLVLADKSNTYKSNKKNQGSAVFYILQNCQQINTGQNMKIIYAGKMVRNTFWSKNIHQSDTVVWLPADKTILIDN